MTPAIVVKVLPAGDTPVQEVRLTVDRLIGTETYTLEGHPVTGDLVWIRVKPWEVACPLKIGFTVPVVVDEELIDNLQDAVLASITMGSADACPIIEDRMKLHAPPQENHEPLAREGSDPDPHEERAD